MDDPLGCYKVTDNGFSELTKIVLNIANKFCDGKLLSILEGGYNLDGNASRSDCLHIKELNKKFKSLKKKNFVINVYLKNNMGLKNGLDSSKYKKALDFSYNFYQNKYRKGQNFILYILIISK